MPGEDQTEELKRLEAEAEAAEAAELSALQAEIDKRDSQPVEPQSAEAPKQEEPKGEPKPTQQPNEANVLRQQIAEKDARLAELQRRLDTDAGTRGGEMRKLNEMIQRLQEGYQRQVEVNAGLQHQVAALGEQVKNPPAPPKPRREFSQSFKELLTSDDLELLEEIRQREPAGSKELPEVTAIKATADAAVKTAMEIRKEQYFDRLAAVVPNLDELCRNAEFEAFSQERVPGTSFTRGDAMQSAANNFDYRAVAENLKVLDERIKAKVVAPPATAPVDPNKPKAGDTALPSPGAAVQTDSEKVKPKTATLKEMESELREKEAQLFGNTKSLSQDEIITITADCETLEKKIEAARSGK